MSVTPSTFDLSGSSISLRRKLTNQAALVGIAVAVIVAVVPLGALVWEVVHRGLGEFGWAFLTRPIPSPRHVGPGMGPAVAGTLLITFWATVMAVPIGVLGAIYVVEYGGSSRLASVIRFMSDVMAGVPSIIMGLFVFTAFTLRFKQVGLGGSIALACLMLPIVIRSTESMLKLVPREMREASQALGASRSRSILTVVLPSALPGITSGVLLAVARAAGETAPLLFTIGIVMDHANWNVFKGANTTLSAQIFTLASSSFIGSKQRAWTSAFTLIALVFVLTTVARVVVSRFSLQRSAQ